jgi:hypothetical protein
VKDQKNIREILAKAHEKLDSANVLFEHQQYDDAISRAYYAVFHAMTAALFFQDMVFSSHAQTIGAFNREFVKSGVFPVAFTTTIQSLFQNRQVADYGAGEAADRDTALSSLNGATAVVTAIEKYLADANAL